MGLPPGVFELGIDVFDEHDRGKGLGTEALTLLLARLFDRERAHRVQVTTDVDNAAMRHVCERMGFVFEGVLRSFMPTADGPRDYAMYAVTKGDWQGQADR
jgi:RimJ/RimL family protein N-acetyltransferase